jgi:hypothetical protein
LDLLGFIRPNRDFSTSCKGKIKKADSRLSLLCKMSQPNSNLCVAAAAGGARIIKKHSSGFGFSEENVGCRNFRPRRIPSKLVTIPPGRVLR